MTTKSMVKSAWAEDMGQFLYHLDPDTRKITRRLEKLQLRKMNSVPSSLIKLVLVGWLVGFYGISTLAGYLMPNRFLIKLSVLFKTTQFSISTQFNCQKHFYFKLFHLFKQLYITIQFSISMQFKCQYSLIVKNISILSYSV